MERLFRLVKLSLVMSMVTVLSLSAQPKSINKTQLDKKIDSLFKDFNDTSSPGYAINIIQNGKVITKKITGWQIWNSKFPLIITRS